MTLVVAWIDGRDVNVVADTMVDFAATAGVSVTTDRNPFGLPKLHPLGDDIVIGIAGDRLHLAIDEVNSIRASGSFDIDHVVERLALWANEHPVAEFIVTSTRGPGCLWRIRNGEPPEPLASAWIGDRAGFSVFQQSQPSDQSLPMDLCAQIGMQAAISSVEATTVGGVLTHASGQVGGVLKLRGTISVVEPEGGVVTSVDGELAVALPDNDERCTTIVVPPSSPGVSGMGVYLPEVQVGYFYPSDDPARNMGRYQDVDATRFVDLVATDFAVELAEFGDVHRGETLAAFVEEENGDRFALPDFLERGGSSVLCTDDAHVLFVAGGRTSLLMHRRGSDEGVVTWSDTNRVFFLDVTSEATTAEGPKIEMRLSIDRNVDDVAPYAAFLFALLNNGGVGTVNGVEAGFLRSMVSQLSGLLPAFAACLDLHVIGAISGQSFRFETSLCEDDATMIRCHRMLLQHHCLRSTIVAYDDSTGEPQVEIDGPTASLHNFEQELPVLSTHFHAKGLPDSRIGQTVWLCARPECTTKLSAT